MRPRVTLKIGDLPPHSERTSEWPRVSDFQVHSEFIASAQRESKHPTRGLSTTGPPFLTLAPV